MIDWEETTLGDVAEILSAKRVFARDYVDNGVPFWRGKEIVELSAGRDVSTELFISEETYQNLGKKAGFPSAGDILLTSVGTLGRVYRLTPRDRIYFKDGNLTWFRNFNERICPQWLLYWLRSNVGQRALDSTKIGSTQQALTIVNLKKIPFLCPPKIEQEKIAATLSALDDKIELNRRMNETLEEMARALFRDWFVDFGPTRRQIEGATDPAAIMGQSFPPEKAATLAPLFPAKLGDDGLPEGWSYSDVGTEFDVEMGQSPPGDTYNENGDGLPFFQGRRDFGFRFPSRRVYCTAPKRISGQDWTLLSVRAPVGDINRAAEKCAIGRGVGAFLHKAGLHSFTYYTGLALRAELQSYDKDGTVFGSINQKQFKGLQVVVPGNGPSALFDDIAKPLDEKIRLNTEENQTLAALRDLLLPKLMSGEVRLKDAEVAV